MFLSNSTSVQTALLEEGRLWAIFCLVEPWQLFWSVVCDDQYIPQVDFKDLGNLKPEQIDDIKRKGSVVIKDVVDDTEAMSWKASLDEFVKSNPNVDG
jgi:hypothetical protein